MPLIQTHANTGMRTLSGITAALTLSVLSSNTPSSISGAAAGMSGLVWAAHSSRLRLAKLPEEVV